MVSQSIVDFVERLQGVIAPFVGQPPTAELARQVEVAVWNEAQPLGVHGPREVIVRFDGPTGAVLVGFDLAFQRRIVGAVDNGHRFPVPARIVHIGDSGFGARHRNGTFELVSLETGEVVWTGSCPVELLATADLLARTSTQEPV